MTVVENAAASERDLEAARGLLAQAKIFYDLLEANRRELFNVFTALRKSHDEVNLHSRFLHALLSHRDAEGQSTFLSHFLVSIDKTSEFVGAEDAVVKREHQNIDILIRHRNWAVIIENKIHAGDQPQQLVRYNEVIEPTLPREILYLTLDGHEPDPQSITDDKGMPVAYTPVSYEDDILPWLVSCQRHAYDDPALRESIAQYRTVVEQLIGHSRGGPYMDRLTELCIQNLPVVVDLADSLVHAKREVLRRIWMEIGKTVDQQLDAPGGALSQKTKAPIFGGNRIGAMLQQSTVVDDWHCLLWPLRGDRGNSGRLHPAPALTVEINRDGLIYGVRCQDANRAVIEGTLEGFKTDIRREPHGWWPWRAAYAAAFDAPTPRAKWAALASLANDEKACRDLAEKIAGVLEEIRETLRSRMPDLFAAP